MQAESLALHAQIDSVNGHQRATITLTLVLSAPQPVQFPQAAQTEHDYSQTLATLPLAVRRYVESLSEVLA